MLYAVSQMDPAAAFVCYLIAVILFVLAAFGVPSPRVGLMALGLAFFALPFCWNALAAA
jgi:hypothetical protein